RGGVASQNSPALQCVVRCCRPHLGPLIQPTPGVSMVTMEPLKSDVLKFQLKETACPPSPEKSTVTHAHTHLCMRSRTRAHTHTHTLSNTHTHTHSLSHTLSRTQAHSLSDTSRVQRQWHCLRFKLATL
ncbi:hypothetical protein ANANG_G00200990, partial [Anguilla anguilla]